MQRTVTPEEVIYLASARLSISMLQDAIATLIASIGETVQSNPDSLTETEIIRQFVQGKIQEPADLLVALGIGIDPNKYNAPAIQAPAPAAPQSAARPAAQPATADNVPDWGDDDDDI